METQEQAWTTIGIRLNGGDKLYTYKCYLPVEVGAKVNIKLPSNLIHTATVQTVHDMPQLSEKWETKWAVVVQTAGEAFAEAEALRNSPSALGASLGLRGEKND